jgi:hypothetical protein
MHGTSQGIGLSSSPTAAKVTVANKSLGNTPLVASLSRKDTHVVRFDMDGFLAGQVNSLRSPCRRARAAATSLQAVHACVARVPPLPRLTGEEISRHP